MTDFNTQIDDNVVLPKRETNFGPRESKYPFAQMKKGQGFALAITGVEGATTKSGDVLTAEQDAERKAHQKQSAFSGIGKRLGIKIKTRYIHTEPEDDEYLQAKWEQSGGPFLLAVHDGAREVEEANEEESEAEQEDNDQDGGAVDPDINL